VKIGPKLAELKATRLLKQR